MRFLHAEDEQKELTYSDVFLLPRRSDVASRMDVCLTPAEGLGTTLPVVVANMVAVAGRRMAETVARRGGLVVLPQDYSLERIRDIVRYVKRCHHVFETPVVLRESQSVQTALNLIYKRSHGAIMVVNDDGYPVGIFTKADAYRRDLFSTLSDVMTKELITLPSDVTPRDAFRTLHEKRLSIAPVVRPDGRLAGVMTKMGALRATLYRPALNAKGELLTAVAVGVSRNLEATVSALVEMGVDVVVLDTAHGHQKLMLDAIRFVRSMLGPSRHIVAGNIVTEQAAEDFIDAGASILKVGIGPGAMCTTRMMTGVGRPQFTAICRTAKAARMNGAHVWADGGVKHPRDVALALAAGASSVMVGSWFAATYESPADIQFDEQGKPYKENYGMASLRAVERRNEQRDPYELASKQYFEEGISTSRLYLRPEQSSAEDILDRISAGLRSACTYTGAHNLEEFHQNALVGVQTYNGFDEGRAHGAGWETI